MRRSGTLAAFATAAVMAAPPTARQAAEDEALVRALVAARLAPLVAEWRERVAADEALARRLDLARLEIDTAGDSPAARLAERLPTRRSLVAAADAARDPRRAAWALDLATDLLVTGPAIDGRVATLAVGIAAPASVEAWRTDLAEAEATLASAAPAIAEAPRGPLALPVAREFRRGWEARHAALGALAAGTRSLLDGRAPEAAVDVPAGAEWNDLALVAALARGTEALRPLAGDASRGPWIDLAAECAIDLAAGDARGRTRLVERAARLVRDGSPAMALLAADAAVRGAAADDPRRFAAWEALLDATPAARRGAVRASVFPRLESLPRTGEPASMGDLELAVRTLAEPMPADLAAELDTRTPPPDGAGESTRLLAFARLRRLAARGALPEAASLAERLATSLGDDPVAAAAAETLVLVRTAVATASTDPEAARAERDALALATSSFPRHPRHDRWAIDLALARLDAGEARDALAATGLVPDGATLGPEARAVAAVALVRLGDPASIARAEAIVRDAGAADSDVAARLALAQALLLARAGRADEARAAADAVVSDPSLPVHLRADAMRVALELGAVPPAHAARGIVAAVPRARGPLLAALRAAATATPVDMDRLKTLLASTAGSTEGLAPEELLTIADANLAAGDADAAAKLAADVIARSTRGGVVSSAAALVRARALRASGGDASLSEAFTLGRDVARQAPQGSPEWWDANALQLEILESSGRNRDQVIPWVNRLKAIDPQLGGAATRARIEAVAKRADS